ncbi:MAG TPA: polysaccharide deacetylase family protein [Lamprocystis sp. (in: g-proteobacteria)]|nr:polysaccharide deacetylase family protein [Lamprocystis sp. (in: g-proteobacteria)]
MVLMHPRNTANADRAGTPARLKHLAQGIVLSALARMARCESPPRLAVMIFHRVLPAADPFLASDPDTLAFAAVMTMIRDQFAPLSLAEGLRRLDDGTLPRRAVCITFDDGYSDNLTVAVPILKRLEIPATVFVASGFLDGGCMWNDRLAAAIRLCPDDTIDLTDFGGGIHHLGGASERALLVSHLLDVLKHGPPGHREQVAHALAARYAPHLTSPMLTRPQVRELCRAGVEIGGHTVTHPILARIDDRDAYREIAENKEDLEGLLGERLRFFAYPNGKPGLDFSPAHAAMVQALGYAAAVTTHPGVSTVATDRFQLPRFTPWDRTPARFGIRLLLNMRHIV